MANGDTEHAQGIWNILCSFSYYPIIYPMGTVFNSTWHPSKLIPVTVFVGNINQYIYIAEII